MYTFENANSGLVMDIQDANMADNTNVRQWESNGADCQKWILRSFGSGNYYWIRSVQDNGYALKAEGSANGANIDIVAFSTRDSAQLFRFTKNLDGTYGILSHVSGDTRLVEVESASMTIGANVGAVGADGKRLPKVEIDYRGDSGGDDNHGGTDDDYDHNQNDYNCIGGSHHHNP